VVKSLILMIAVAILIWLIRPWESLPPEWNPWAPLAMHHEMTPVTRWKLNGLKDDREHCRALLASVPEDRLDHLPLEDYTPVAECPLTNVVRVTRTGVTFNNRFTASCPLVVAWVMFEQQQLQPLANEHVGSALVHIDHYGTFACRNIYHREDARRSQHATASAFDVAAFRFADGTRVSVLDDWDNDDEPAKKDFLRSTRDAACDYFGTVLGPDYNQPHENHFHFDTSTFGVCH